MRKLFAAAAFSAIATSAFAEGHGGLPGMTGIDHVGFTVPDLEQAVTFFGDVLGCASFYPLGPFSGGDSTWMADHLNVDAKATIPAMRLMRCGNGANFEIFDYTAPERRLTPPRNSDVGGHHIAFYTTDMPAAVEYLKENGVTVLGAPTTMTEGPSAGETWVYFLAPWGMQLELVSYPDGKAYEAEFDNRLWDPRS
ncbi:VOC family protein [Sulfitobacter aestuariivivens]|uniref:VOC family protein n=1 Tax=Sulfitobacter aestuariivivens TaxID=2766981 RepID=A0A927D646_9RHOB|nr:VOC family protein [Sulfitobacter aestuariivivens]MBD3664172.1 VOC family protein [Sulfitobacter aestuariivivens]